MFSRRTEWKITPNRLSTAIGQARASSHEILDLTISNPTRAALIYDRVTIVDSLRTERALDYDPQPKGLLPAREAVAKYYAERGEQVDAERLFLTSGTSEGYSYLFRLLANPDEEILIPAPSYPLFEFLADLDNVKLVSYPLIYDHGWQMDFHSLANVISPRTRAIVLLNPNNPTGSYVSAKERETLNEICQEHRLALIVDEVFLDYAHDRKRRPTFALNQDVLTFSLSGLSKICAVPQMKLAWIAASGPENDRTEAEQRLEVIADSYLSVGAPVQWAVASLLAQRNDLQQQLLQRIAANMLELDRQLDSDKPCTRLRVEGGWYAILRVPVTQSDEDLAIKLLQAHRVLVHPGHFYDFPEDGYVVISLIAPNAEFREGISRLLQFVG
jgi:aspartate/methionine/tyrosine aminotransferase